MMVRVVKRNLSQLEQKKAKVEHKSCIVERNSLEVEHKGEKLPFVLVINQKYLSTKPITPL